MPRIKPKRMRDEIMTGSIALGINSFGLGGLLLEMAADELVR